MTIRFHDRWLLDRLRHRLAAPGLHVLVGGRRTGKTTLIDALLPSEALRVALANPAERARFLWRPQDLSALCHAVPRSTAHPTLWIDDVHLVPELLDVARTVVARERRGWRIIVTTLWEPETQEPVKTAANTPAPGVSSVADDWARLEQDGADMASAGHAHPSALFEQSAAGSVVRVATRVQPLLLAEHPAPPHVLPVAGESPLVVPWPGGPGRRWSFPAWTLGERLAFGSLPGVVLTPERERAGSLRQQALALLEEDVRRHTPIRDWPGFMRFARQAALESGRVQNLAGIANETGLSAPTVRAYYVLLARLGMIVRVPGWTQGPRSNYLSTPRCYLFDLGIRHALAGLEPAAETVAANPAPLFEHWVGLELARRLAYLGGRLHHLRTRDGAEIDFIVEHDDRLTPVQVRWTERPTHTDARHLTTFIAENRDRCDRGFVVCGCPRPMALTPHVVAIPWQCL